MEDQKRRVVVHAFTDSTGETTINICNVVMSQFPNYEANVFTWPFIKTIAELDLALESVFLNPGIIIYSILPEDLIEHLNKKILHRRDIMIISALDGAIKGFASHLGVKISGLVGRENSFDKEYQQRMEAMNYTVLHDDGVKTSEIEEADIVIIGPSRTAKTPTSLYLANRGFKVMNIPFVSMDIIPNEVYATKNPLIVGLSIDPVRLCQLRKSRIFAVHGDGQGQLDDYMNVDIIEKELLLCKQLFGRLCCPVVDVSERSVEEIATQIIKLFNFSKHNKLQNI